VIILSSALRHYRAVGDASGLGAAFLVVTLAAIFRSLLGCVVVAVRLRGSMPGAAKCQKFQS
jgi:hypothetical protein